MEDLLRGFLEHVSGQQGCIGPSIGELVSQETHGRWYAADWLVLFIDERKRMK